MFSVEILTASTPALAKGRVASTMAAATMFWTDFMMRSVLRMRRNAINGKKKCAMKENPGPNGF